MPSSTIRILAGIVTVLALLALVIPVVYVFWPRVTAANYQRIEIAMSKNDVLQIFGKPRFENHELGIIGKSGAYVTNDFLTDAQKLAKGYQKYQRLQWSSSEISIIVVFDSDDLVATKYKSDGH